MVKYVVNTAIWFALVIMSVYILEVIAVYNNF